jgi:hypothetical protein
LNTSLIVNSLSELARDFVKPLLVYVWVIVPWLVARVTY